MQYGSVQFPEVVHLGCVYTNFTYLGGTIPQLQDPTRQFTTPYTAIRSELTFRAHALLICTAPRSRTQTVHLGFVYTNYTYLGGTVAHFTPDGRLRYCTRLFSTP